MIDLKHLNKKELAEIIASNAQNPDLDIFKQASALCSDNYGKQVFMRGLIEFSNYCHNNCYYCGIRRDNPQIKRYRLNQAEIIETCQMGYDLGFRTFVLQSGEDDYFTDKIICQTIAQIKNKFPQVVITLSLGERNKTAYASFYKAGARRYLLRHETANNFHFNKLHPKILTFEKRKKALYNLKNIGFQTGAGFMVGSPYQTWENLAEDLLFLKDLKPQMVGIGPFIPHKDTPFAKFSQGKTNLTLLMLALTRILLPKVLLPATTALATIDPIGQEKALEAGANVIMPNLTPPSQRANYNLYNNKKFLDGEAAENIKLIKEKLAKVGFNLVYTPGNHLDFTSSNCK